MQFQQSLFLPLLQDNESRRRKATTTLSSFLQGSFPKFWLFKTSFNFSATYIIFVQKWKETWAELSEIQLGANTENIGTGDTVIKKNSQQRFIPMSDCSPLQGSAQVNIAEVTMPQGLKQWTHPGFKRRLETFQKENGLLKVCGLKN